MPTLFSRIFHFPHLLNSLFFHFLPNTIASLVNPLITHRPLSQQSITKLSSSSSSVDMDSTDLRRVFQMFDRNGDGRITKKELNDSLKNMGIFIPKEELHAMIEKIDVDGDGCVDISEFGNLYRSIMDEKDDEDEIKQAFDVFDLDGDGFITIEELRSVLASLGLSHGRTAEDCKMMISKVDGDGDGMVNLNEFKEMVRGGGFATLSSGSSN